MKEPFTEQIAQMADSMGVALYQRFTLNEASLFLRSKSDEVEKIVKRHKIAYIQQVDGQVEFFGYQLVEYLVGQIVPQKSSFSPPPENNSERILSSAEVQDITGLSRTTIWRLERSGDFPARLPLCPGRVGWRYSDVMEWVERK